MIRIKKKKKKTRKLKIKANENKKGIKWEKKGCCMVVCEHNDVIIRMSEVVY